MRQDAKDKKEKSIAAQREYESKQRQESVEFSSRLNKLNQMLYEIIYESPEFKEFLLAHIRRSKALIIAASYNMWGHGGKWGKYSANCFVIEQSGNGQMEITFQIRAHDGNKGLTGNKISGNESPVNLFKDLEYSFKQHTLGHLSELLEKKPDEFAKFVINKFGLPEKS